MNFLNALVLAANTVLPWTGADTVQGPTMVLCTDESGVTEILKYFLDDSKDTTGVPFPSTCEMSGQVMQSPPLVPEYFVEGPTRSAVVGTFEYAGKTWWTFIKSTDT